MTNFPSVEKSVLGIPGAGRRSLLEALGRNPRLPAGIFLCVLDAERMDAPAQLALLDELAAEPARETVFALNKADRISNLSEAVAHVCALLEARGIASPSIYPTCAAAARLFSRSADELSERELAAREAFYERFAPGENCLSAFAVTAEPALTPGGRELDPARLREALHNTGVPALAETLKGLSGEEKALLIEAPSDPAPDLPSAFYLSGDFAETVSDRPPEKKSEDSLAALLERADSASCAELLNLARAAGAADAPEQAREQALDRLHAAYNARQIEELDAMTRNAEDLELDTLRALADRINAGPYTVQTRTPYVARLNLRIDGLQTVALDELCAGVEEADPRTLARIREALERTDCAEVLKTAYFRRIDGRQQKLDIEALDRVTAGAETMTEKELRAVAVTLEAKNWNPRYVNAYRHRIDLCREALLYRQVQQELTDLNDMERREVLDLQERIEGKALPPLYTAAARRQIGEKLFRMDMLRLMALQNEFDRLDFDGIDELRAQVARGDFCERAKGYYLNRLLARENALILENTSARAELSRQLISRHKLRISDFTFASPGRDYQTKLDDFWIGTGLEQPRDIPVFLFDNGSRYALTATRFYFKAGRHLEYVPIESIDHFQIMKQHLSFVLQIVGTDNSYRLTEARISRGGAERTLDFLNDCIRRWASPGPAGRLAAKLRVRPLDAADYTAPVEPETLRPQIAWELFSEAYQAAGLREGYLIRPGDEDDMQRVRKLRENFGLPENAPLVWYGPASRFGPVKEGVAFGAQGIYQKEGKDPVRTVPLAEICTVCPADGKRMLVTTLQNETVTLSVPDQMIPLIADYVRAIQLGDYLRTQEEQA